MTPDRELLRQYAEQGDEAAFAEIVRRHVNWVYSTALRLVGGDAHLAQDVVQVVFSDCARKAARLSRYDAPGGWLHTATRFVAAKIVDREQRRRQREQEAFAMQIEPTTPEVCWERLRPALDDAIGRLSDSDRAAVVMRFFENKSHREIGDLAGLSEDAARKRVERAVEKLRLQFARRGITVSATLLAEGIDANSVQAAPTGLANTLTSIALKGTVTTSLSSALLFAIFSMTTKTKIIIAAILLVVAAIPAYHLMTASSNTAPEASSLTPALSEKMPKTAAQGAGASVSSRPLVVDGVTPPARSLAGGNLSASPSPSLRAAMGVKITPTPVAAPDAATLAALKTGLIAWKRSEDLDKLDPVGKAQLKAWALSDPQAIVTWLSDVTEDNKSHEHAMEAMIGLVIDDSPQTALVMASTINDPIVHDSRISTTLMVLALQDPAAAINALNSVNFSADDTTERPKMAEKIQKVQAGQFTDEERAKLLDEIHK